MAGLTKAQLRIVVQAAMMAATIMLKAVLLTVLTVAQVLVLYRKDPTPYFERSDLRLTPEEKVRNEIFSRNPYRCYEAYRMDEPLISKLCELLRGEVHETPTLPLIVQVAIYLDWIAHYPSIRVQKSTFKVSHTLIEHARSGVRKAVVKVLYPRYVKQATAIPDLSDNPKRRFFQGAYGCVDGSHLAIEVRTQEKENWRNRKNEISTNAVLICGVDGELVFQYANFGAEGPGGDTQVLRHASAMDLTWVPDGFLLGDAGYGLSLRLLTPYRGVRYHLKEFSESTLGRPGTKEELFNLRHASFRNQIERAFGVLKKRFRICREPLTLGKKSDMWLTFYSCVAIHNFIRTENKNLDNEIEAEVMEEQRREDLTVNNRSADVPDGDDATAVDWRDVIATNMWNDYQQQHRV